MENQVTEGREKKKERDECPQETTEADHAREEKRISGMITHRKRESEHFQVQPAMQ